MQRAEGHAPMATKEMNEDWRRLRDRIGSLWAEVDFEDDAVKQARGSLGQMVTRIHQRNGEPRPDIRRKISALT